MSNLGPSNDKFGTFWRSKDPLVPILVALMVLALIIDPNIHQIDTSQVMGPFTKYIHLWLFNNTFRYDLHYNCKFQQFLFKPHLPPPHSFVDPRPNSNT